MIRQLWNGFDGLDPSLESHVFDTTDETPEDTAGRIRQQLRSSALKV